MTQIYVKFSVDFICHVGEMVFIFVSFRYFFIFNLGFTVDFFYFNFDGFITLEKKNLRVL